MDPGAVAPPPSLGSAATFFVSSPTK